MNAIVYNVSFSFNPLGNYETIDSAFYIGSPSSNVTISNLTLSNAETLWGGIYCGLLNPTATVIIENSLFINNSNLEYGSGAITLDLSVASTIVKNSVFIGN